MVTFEVGLGVTFLVVGIALLLVEAAVPGFFIGVPATILIVLGLFGMYIPGFFISPWAPVTALVVSGPTILLTILLYQRLAPPEPPSATVATSLIGRRGMVVARVVPDSLRGKVNIGNQIWSATSVEQEIEEGIRVRVVDSEGVHVVVEPVEAPLPPGERVEDKGVEGS